MPESHLNLTSESSTSLLKFDTAGSYQMEYELGEIELVSPYKFIRPLGSGGGGFVMMALDQTKNVVVAIKKITGPYRSPEMARRCLRELHLLKTIHHPNVIGLVDCFQMGNGCPDLYFVMDFIPTDLRRLLAQDYTFPLDLTRLLMYQLVKALDYLHRRGIMHRDLKPENLLLDENYRLVVQSYQDDMMTGYVSTRFYRAPEIMLSWRGYSSSVDVWSAGCIFSELLTGRVLFPGIDHVHHVNLIFELLGSPSEAVVDKICGPKTREYLLMLPKFDGTDFRQLYGPDVSEEALDLLRQMLTLDPSQRVTASAALCHPFFESLRPQNPVDLQPPSSSDGGLVNTREAYDHLDSTELKALIEAEVATFQRPFS